jgi:hypothetical protein
MSYAYVAGMLLFMVRGQLLLNGSSALGRGVEPADRIAFLAQLFANPWVLAAVAAGFGAAMCYMLTLNRLPLSHGYPFMGLSFVAVMLPCAGVGLGSQG